MPAKNIIKVSFHLFGHPDSKEEALLFTMSVLISDFPVLLVVFVANPSEGTAPRKNV
jgi:hypothetical protein